MSLHHNKGEDITVQRKRERVARGLKTIHLVFVAIWFGGVMTWFPMSYGVDLNDFDSTYSTYLNMRSVAWGVIGWGGIGSFLTGVLNGLFTQWRIFKFRWVTVKFFAVILLILYGMFFLEARLLSNIDLLESQAHDALTNPQFIMNHFWIKSGLILEAAAFVAIISISVFKPWSARSTQ